MARAAIRRGRCGHGLAGRDQPGATATPRGPADPAGERLGRLPHGVGGPAYPAPELEPRGTALGTSRGRHPSGRSGATAGPRRAGRGVAAAACSAWTKAEAAFARFEQSEAGWRIVHAALQVFRPGGQLNDRSWAAQQIASAVPKLSGREWSKVCGFLRAQETLTFLDRLHRQLREAQPDEERLGALVRLWWLRRQRPRGSSAGPTAGSGHVAHLVQMVVCHKGDAN